MLQKFRIPIKQIGKKVVDNNNGTNSDDNGTNKYYFQYTGNETTVDLNDKNVYPQTSDGCPSIQSTRVYNTYKMFANNTQLERVFIPSGIAIHAYGLTKYDSGIAKNTFEGTSQEIDCIYRTPNLKDDGEVIDARGSGLTSTYDKTGIITQSNVITYVALDSNNITRKSVPPATISGDSSKYVSYTYVGKVQNVFVTNELENLVCMFMRNYYNENTHLETYLPAVTEIKSVLIDDKPNTNWKSVYRMFGGQTFTKLPTRFNLPSTATGCNTAFYYCSNLESLPDGFRIPNGTTYLTNIFNGCVKLSATISIPSSVTAYAGMFTKAGSQSANKITASNGKQYSIIVNCKSRTVYNSITEVDGVLHKVLDTSTTQSLDDSSRAGVINDVGSIQDNTNRIVINDETDWVRVAVRKKSGNGVNGIIDGVQDSSDKIVIEDETDYVSVTVNKKSVENVSEESKSEGDGAEQ